MLKQAVGGGLPVWLAPGRAPGLAAWEAWAVRAAVVERPACLQRPLARPGFAAGRFPFRYLEEPALKRMPAKLPRGAGGDRRPGAQSPPAQSTKYPEAQLPGRRKHPLPPRRISPASLKPPHLLPLSPRRTMALCTSSQQQPLHSGQWGREGGGKCGAHSRDTGWTLSPSPKGRVMREGDRWVGLSIPSPAPPTAGNQTEAPHFL